MNITDRNIHDFHLEAALTFSLFLLILIVTFVR